MTNTSFGFIGCDEQHTNFVMNLDLVVEPTKFAMEVRNRGAAAGFLKSDKSWEVNYVDFRKSMKPDVFIGTFEHAFSWAVSKLR